jgi:hypothetical protein
MSGASDVRLNGAQRREFNRIQLLRAQQADRERFLLENEGLIDPTDAQAVREGSQQAVNQAVLQAEDNLQRLNSHVQTIPSASADVNERRTLADIAIQQEQQRRETLATLGSPPVVPSPPAPPAAPVLPTPPPTVPPPPGPSDTAALAAPPVVPAVAGPSDTPVPAAPPEVPSPPTVALGPAPTGSSSETPQNVAQQAASTTANQAPTQTTNAPTTAPTSAATPGASTERVGNIQLQFEPNVHNQYDRVTYVFKLCMINDLDAEDPDLLNKFLNNQIRKVVIAESGVTTGFAIGDVEITDSISANFRNRSNITTGLRIQIIEPYGLTLPDKMFQASKQLGLQNWRLAPFLLQLEFRYIKSDGSLYTPQGDQKLVRVYQVIVTDFDAQLKETGTVYDVQASVKGNLGFQDAYQIMAQSYRVSTKQGSAASTEFGEHKGDNTVATFFTNLGETITKMYVDVRANNTQGVRLPILIYKFIVTDPLLAEQEINFTPEANSRRASFTTGDANVGEITVSRGQSITALVDDIMASLKNPNFFLQGVEQGGLIKIPVIECVTRNVGWDLLTNDYVRELTFFIRTKLSNRPVPNEQWGFAIQNSANIQQARLDTISKSLRKRYDYFYTGQNTEIISCDIKFNQMHVVPQPLLQVSLPVSAASAERVNPNNTPGTTVIPATTIGQRLEQQRRELTSNLGALNSLGTTAQDRSATEEDLAAEARRLAAERTEIERTIAQISTQSVVPFEGTPEAIRRVSNTSADAEQFRQLLNSITERNRQQAGERVFAEDIRLPIQDDILRLSYYSDPRDIINNMTRAVAQDTGANPSTNPAPNATRALVSSILQQIYDKSGQHLLEIDLEIRGDPYWLGKTDLERTRELRNFLQTLGGATNGANPNTSQTQSSAQNRPGMVDKQDQDANILLKFRSGVAPNKDTGFMNLSDESTFFYGIYTVIECIHEFKSGKFTQRLKAYRDALINIDTLRQADRTIQSASQPTQVAPSQPGVAGVPVPESAALLASRAANNEAAARASRSVAEYRQVTAPLDEERVTTLRQDLRAQAQAARTSIGEFNRASDAAGV